MTVYDPLLREARRAAHAAFDPLWLGAIALSPYCSTMKLAGRGSGRRRKAHRRICRTARRRAYEWLAEQMGMIVAECHIRMFDADQCRRVCELAAVTDAEGIFLWAKDRERKAA